MKLTKEILASYVGGQMEVMNSGVSEFWYDRRGEISNIAIEKHVLKVGLSWFADKTGPVWTIIGYHISRQIDLGICDASQPVSHIRGGKCIFLDLPSCGQEIILYSRDGDKLNPATQGFEHSIPYG